MEKVWNIAPSGDQDAADALGRSVGLNPILANLLIRRGIDTPDKAQAFLNPDMSQLHDPYLMQDMGKAVARLNDALAREERILVYGDYDVDGATAVALVFKSLEHLVSSIDRLGYYVPNRYTEGYGISRQGIDYAAKHGYSLVVALDCGIKAVEQMRYARQLGIDFIICDHHVAGSELPDVVACLDAKRPDCSYPDKELSGCGVGYKLMQALYISRGRDLEELNEFTDLLVVSIASDIVPMLGENRVLASYGLRQINRRPNIGLRSIMYTAGVRPGHVTIADIVFKIGPRINAAGRMRNGSDAVRLLLCPTLTEADAISQLINDSNEQRKELDREVTHEAMELIGKHPQMQKSHSTVIYEPRWSKGVIGIVASRLTETFRRPAVILTRSQAEPGMAAGSARSVVGFDLYSAIESCADLLKDFGGHTYAAGLTLAEENVPEFMRRFEAYAQQHLPPEQNRTPHINIDCEVGLDDINNDLVEQLARLEPFGPRNERPVFMTRDVFDYSTSKPFGRGRRHLKLDIIDSHGRAVRSGMGFGLGKLYANINHGQCFDVCFSVDNDEDRGISLNVIDIKGH